MFEVKSYVNEQSYVKATLPLLGSDISSGEYASYTYMFPFI